MSLRRQASYNPTLTTFAQGVSQDLTSALAEFIAPTVPVSSSMGYYKAFDEKNAFQVQSTGRALGGSARRIEFVESDPTFNCQPQALEITIDDAERDAAGPDVAAMEEGKTRTLVAVATVSHEDKVLTQAKTLAAVAARGQWSDTSVDPISEIDEQIEAIATATGMMPNAIAFGLGAWRVFRKHPKVIARQPGATIIGLSEAQAASMLLNPAAQIRVGVLSKDATKFGSAASKSNIVGAEVFIFLRSPNPTAYDPSWMKTFTIGTGGVTAVRQYRDEKARSDVLAVDWSEDIQIVGSICARRLTIS